MKGFIEGHFLELILLVIVLSFFSGIIFAMNENKLLETKISSLGYDLKDVKVFLRQAGMNRSDFIDSEGLRLQYEQFRKGIVNAKRKENDSNGSGFATGLVVGSVLGSTRTK